MLGNSSNTITFESKDENLYYPGVYDIEPKELAQKIDQVRLIDVRQPEEFTGDLGHIPGSQLIVLDNFENEIHKVPTDKPIVLICRSGGRSAMAATLAVELGLKNIYNLKGGMILWNELHLETEI